LPVDVLLLFQRHASSADERLDFLLKKKGGQLPIIKSLPVGRKNRDSAPIYLPGFQNGAGKKGDR